MDNIYLRMPLGRVRSDALTGVKLAREAYRQRDPVGADFDLGPVVSPAEQQAHRQRAMDAITDYERRQQHKMRAQNG